MESGRSNVSAVPIRLMQTHTTCRMLPLAILGTQSTPSGCMRKADRHGFSFLLILPLGWKSKSLFSWHSGGELRDGRKAEEVSE